MVLVPRVCVRVPTNSAVSPCPCYIVTFENVSFEIIGQIVEGKRKSQDISVNQDIGGKTTKIVNKSIESVVCMVGGSENTENVQHYKQENPHKQENIQFGHFPMKTKIRLIRQD